MDDVGFIKDIFTGFIIFVHHIFKKISSFLHCVEAFHKKKLPSKYLNLLDWNTN